MPDWESVLKEAGERAQEVSDGLLGKSRGREVQGRGAGGDATMRFDAETEQAIVEVVRRVPGTRVIAEEVGVVGGADSKWTVIIDPIDGSSNFARGIPFYCASIGVADGKGVESIRYGLVRNLPNGDVYYAEKGKGARLNGTKIRAGGVTELKEACIGVDLAKGSIDVIAAQVPLIGAIRKQMHLGANALELCYVADGKIDGFVDMRNTLRIVDFAAGYLIAKEAGALFTDPHGGRVDPRFSLDERFNVVCASNASLQRKLLAVIRG